MDPQELKRRMAWASQTSVPSRDELLARQNELLIRTVRHAAAAVPFYRKKLQAVGFSPDAFRGRCDLQKLPTTERAELQTAPDSELLARGADSVRLGAFRTSGSSGRPLTIRMSREENALYGAFRFRTYREMGLRLGGGFASIGLIKGAQPPPPRDASVFHHRVIDCLQPVAEMAKELSRLAPRNLSGFPGALTHLAESCSPEDLQSIRPERVVLSGEMSTAGMRESIRAAFDTQVTSTYACNEVRWIGYECQSTGAMHLLDDSVLIEILDKENRPVLPGEEGDVVITSLHATWQPFIRYRIGDRATQGAPSGGPSGCTCGAPYSTLVELVGRMNDYLVLPDGQRMNAYHLTSPLLKLAPFVGRYQLVQETPEWVRWRVVPLYRPEEPSLEIVRQHAEQVLGPNVRFDIEFCDALEQDQNGKFRIVLSKLQSAFGP